MFYHLDGHWNQTSVHGSWLMRPIFGKKVSLIGVDEIVNNATRFIVRPNPAKNTFRLEFENSTNKNFRYQIFNTLGALVLEENINSSKDIDISKLEAGIFFVRLLNLKDHSMSVQKLISIK